MLGDTLCPLNDFKQKVRIRSWSLLMIKEDWGFSGTFEVDSITELYLCCEAEHILFPV